VQIPVEVLLNVIDTRLLTDMKEKLTDLEDRLTKLEDRLDDLEG
jgi:BMFP domain-containing protein YqiC